MASKRMFSKQITDSDAFMDMPLSTQCLYFHLGMQADDDGFINAPKRIQRVIGASDDDLNILIMKKFIIPFQSGVVVQKHWHINNNIRSDRYKETVYLEEKEITVKVGSDTLVPVQDYRIVENSYRNNIKKGTAQVTIEGVGNYGGTYTAKFAIKSKTFDWRYLPILRLFFQE